MEKKYKFISIRQNNGELYDKFPVYRIYNNISKAQIGILSYYKQWKEYVFSSLESCVFSRSCLKDVDNFMELANKEIKK